MDSIIHSRVPSFSLEAYHNGVFKAIAEEDLLGKWSILFFYRSDFSDHCLAELMELVEIQDELHRKDVEIYAINTDSHFVHKAWHNASGEIRRITFPMLGDRSGTLCQALGVIEADDDSIHPSTFILNPEGEIKIAEMYNRKVLRRGDELLRKIKAAKFVSEHPGEVCPARWQEGDESLKPSMDLVGKI